MLVGGPALWQIPVMRPPSQAGLDEYVSEPPRRQSPLASAARRQGRLVWPAMGVLIGVLVSTNPVYAPPIPLHVGMAVWGAAMVLVLVLSAHPVGAQVGALVAGLLMAVPCFLWASPLSRFLLMCFMAMPLLAAAALVLAPPIPGFRARLAYLRSPTSLRGAAISGGWDLRVFIDARISIGDH